MAPQQLRAGTRVRLLDSVPWPQRRGLEAIVVVDPNGPGVYPCDKNDPYRVVVFIPDDPLDVGDRKWTCAVTVKDVEVVELPPWEGWDS